MSKVGLIKSGAAFFKSLFKSSSKTKAILRSPAQRAGKQIKLENQKFRFDNNGKLKSIWTDRKDGTYSNHLYDKNGKLTHYTIQDTDTLYKKNLYYEYENDRLVKITKHTYHDNGTANITKQNFNYDPNSSKLKSIDTFQYYTPDCTSEKLIYTSTKEIK